MLNEPGIIQSFALPTLYGHTSHRGGPQGSLSILKHLGNENARYAWYGSQVYNRQTHNQPQHHNENDIFAVVLNQPDAYRENSLPWRTSPLMKGFHYNGMYSLHSPYYYCSFMKKYLFRHLHMNCDTTAARWSSCTIITFCYIVANRMIRSHVQSVRTVRIRTGPVEFVHSCDLIMIRHSFI